MNKTISINISGFIFNIEEDGYTALSLYLERLKLFLNDSIAGNEILHDIEARIAELFTEIISEKNQVIVLSDVEKVISILGQPEDYELEDEDFEKKPGGDSNSTDSNESHSSSGEKTKHRVFRNPDDKFAGGVLGGLAAYFDSDPLWWRLCFVFVIFLGWGTPIPLYIILWVIIPEAKTRAEKLQMRGEPVTLESIKKTIEDEADHLKHGAENLKNSKTASRARSAIQDIVQFFLTAFGSIFEVLRFFIGGAFILFGLGFTVAIFLAAIFGITASGSPFESHTPFDLVFGLFPADSTDNNLIIYGATLLGLSISISLVFTGIRLLFRKISRTKTIRFGLIFLFTGLIGFGMLSTGLIRTGFDYRNQEQVSSKQIIPTLSDTLIVTVKDRSDLYTTLSHRKSYNSLGDYKIIDRDVYCNDIRFDIQRIDSSRDFEMKLEYYANGSSNQLALKRAQNIQYTFTADSSGKIVFDPYFSFDLKDRIRNQQIDITLYVPIGKSVYLDPSSVKILSNIKNVSNTWDNDMVGYTWTMTTNGLFCPIFKPSY